jgi:hypothetical protein
VLCLDLPLGKMTDVGVVVREKRVGKNAARNCRHRGLMYLAVVLRVNLTAVSCMYMA